MIVLKPQSKSMLTPEELFHEKIYWLNQLSGELPETNLILDYVRPLRDEGNNKTLSFDLSQELSAAIFKFTQGSNLSIYLVLVSALKIVLHKYTGNHDIIVGSPLYKQASHSGLTKTVVPLRTLVTTQLTFREFLLHVKNTVVGAYSHPHYPLSELVRLLNLPQSQNRCPIFDIVVLWDRIHSTSDRETLNNDITVSGLVKGENIRLTIDYNGSLYREKTIKLMSQTYKNILGCIFEDIHIKLQDILFLKESDRHQLLKEFNNNSRTYPLDQTINQLFEQQVKRVSKSRAVVDNTRHLTYKYLNNKANQLAKLLRNLGIKAGEFVGILKDRDINFAIAILAIYKAGGAYVPIDSTYPPDRIKYMLSNSEVRVLLTDVSFLNNLADLSEQCSHLKSLICLDAKPDPRLRDKLAGISLYDPRDFEQLTTENLEAVNRGIDPAYMLYTSGSTGLPKGAIIRQDGAINHIYAQFEALGFTETFSFLQTAPASSDISVWQFLAPLLIGGTTVIADRETVFNPEKLFKVLKSEKIAIAELVPVVLTSLLNYISRLPTQQRGLPDLKWMMVTGESVSVELINQWLHLYPSIHVVNAYGPTEAADDITQLIVEKPLPANQRTVPIGKPLANLTLYILDSQMQLVPIGVPGEICVSGVGVGNGYWKDEEKTNLSFVSNPFPNPKKNNHDLLYKTGDLGRWLPDGTIEFLGRIGSQVKIRGFRIELGEIEAVLSQHPAVQEVVVVTQDDERGSQRLVAYTVANTEPAPTFSELGSFLKEKLPDYMIPYAFVFLTSLPITPSGKVDRNALPVPDNFRPDLDIAYVMPRNEVEQTIAQIWQDILGVEKVGIHDNFFELGGHSLLATQVISQMRKAFQVELPLRHLFEAPTVADQGFAIQQKQGEKNTQNLNPISKIERENAEQVLANLNQMSEQDVDSLLQEMLAEQEVNL
jgi:amino acid adenylation domain-containing protein